MSFKQPGGACRVPTLYEECILKLEYRAEGLIRELEILRDAFCSEGHFVPELSVWFSLVRFLNEL